MKLFIVRSTVYTRHYMRDGKEECEEIDIVMAEGEDDARAKVEAHYSDQGSAYCVSYDCHVHSVKQVIE